MSKFSRFYSKRAVDSYAQGKKPPESSTSPHSAWSSRPAIDVARTVSATLASSGIPKLRYRHARLHPEYLVLVEADHDDDFPMLWAGRLKKQGFLVGCPNWRTDRTAATA